MIKYPSNILRILKDAGYSTKALREMKLLSQSTMQRLRHNEPVNTSVINMICYLTGLQPGDILMFEATDEDDQLFNDKLHEYYCSNSDDNLYPDILGDFKDPESETSPEF